MEDRKILENLSLGLVEVQTDVKWLRKKIAAFCEMQNKLDTRVRNLELADAAVKGAAKEAAKNAAAVATIISIVISISAVIVGYII